MIRRGLLLLFLIGLWPLESPGQDVAANLPLFRQEMGRQITRTLRRREGLVLWLDRQGGERWVFGNPELLQRPFLPGSWLKLVVAESAAEQSLNPKYFCGGQDRIGGKKRHCWTHRGHGDLDLARALGISCNLYFERLGLSLGYPALRAALIQAGFASAAALPERPGGLDPALLAIGDEPSFTVTPEEAWNFWLGFSQRLGRPSLSALRQGLRRAVSQGTARQVSEVRLEILGKTGTGDALAKSYATNGWFLGAYPVEQPRWLLLVFLQEAHGFAEAADLAERIYRLADSFEVLR
ncbi:MAG TPA: penicillin-binding transpeptidase domain-containing protein [bacterium]|nr:penicillin-binding transpeptidase domain-containing protein [bacterium]